MVILDQLKPVYEAGFHLGEVNFRMTVSVNMNETDLLLVLQISRCCIEFLEEI